MFTNVDATGVGEHETHPYDAAGNVIKYEAGELTEAETVQLFQYLVDSGDAWRLQGSYARKAMELIRDELVFLPGT